MVVIGQSPRPSVVDEIAAVLSPGLEIDLRGALDGMTRAEIDAIPPRDGHDALFTLLPNGDSVTISKKAVEARAAIQIENFAREGVKVAMLACTGKFPNLAPNGLVILPSRCCTTGRGGFPERTSRHLLAAAGTDRADRRKMGSDRTSKSSA